MSIVSSDTLRHLRSLRSAAQGTDSYQKGYRYAMEGLNAAIAQIEQLDVITQGFKVKLEKE